MNSRRIRLADLEGLYQEAAAERMDVSRQTFARILTHARAVVAEGLIEGKALLIETGAAVDGPAPPLTCPVHGGARRRGRECRCEGKQACDRRSPPLTANRWTASSWVGSAWAP